MADRNALLALYEDRLSDNYEDRRGAPKDWGERWPWLANRGLKAPTGPLGGPVEPRLLAGPIIDPQPVGPEPGPQWGKLLRDILTGRIGDELRYYGATNDARVPYPPDPSKP